MASAMHEPRKPYILDRILAPVTFGTGPVDRLVRFFSQDVWRVEPEQLPPVRRTLNRMARILFLAYRGFVGDRAMARASGLTYITALSIIPLLAMAFSVLQGFGVYRKLIDEQLDPYLDRLVGPLSFDPVTGAAAGNDLRLAIHDGLQGIEAMDLGSLGSIGLLIVMWAAIRLLGSVEGAFNDIWGVRKSRSLVRKISDYLTIAIVVPVFLVVAIGATTKWMRDSADAAAAQESVLVAPADPARSGAEAPAHAEGFGQPPLVTHGLPMLAAWIVLTFIYLALPNTRTRFLSSAIGGLVAGTLWYVALVAHLTLQVGVANFNALYAGFAAIPVFLVWVQVSWVIVLLGAEVAFAHEHEPAYRGMASYRSLGHGAKEVLALRAMVRITHDFLSGAGRHTTAAVAAELSVPPGAVEEVLRTLESSELVASTQKEGDRGAVFVLGRDPEQVTVKMILDALKRESGEEALPARDAADEEVDRLLARMEEEQDGSAYNLSLREIVRRAERRALDASAAVAKEPGVQPS